MAEVPGFDDVDIKMRTRNNGLWEFDVSQNRDLVPISGDELIKQRIYHRLLVRKRYTPIMTDDLIHDEILKKNVDEEGNPYYPGDLDKLGYPDYGSLLQFYVGWNDSDYLRGMLLLDLIDAIGQEASVLGILSVDDLKIDSIEQGYKITLKYSTKNGSQTSEMIV